MTLREIAVVFVVLVPILPGVLLFRKTKASAGWHRTSLRALGIFLVFASLITLLNLRARSASRMPAPVFSADSPNGQYSARIVEPDGDLLPTQFFRVALHRKGHLFDEEVFEGKVEPNVDWLDDRTLQLVYPAADESLSCGSSWSEVAVICKQVPAPEFNPRIRE